MSHLYSPEQKIEPSIHLLTENNRSYILTLEGIAFIYFSCYLRKKLFFFSMQLFPKYWNYGKAMVIIANLVSPMKKNSLWTLAPGFSVFIKSTVSGEHLKVLQIHSKSGFASGFTCSIVMLHRKKELYRCIILTLFVYVKFNQQLSPYVEESMDFIGLSLSVDLQYFSSWLLSFVFESTKKRRFHDFCNEL